MAEIKIDSKIFQERISHFVTAWKNDLRTKDGLFGGASSLVVMMGKVEEIPEFHKNNAVHVRHHHSIEFKLCADVINWIIVLAPRLRIPNDPDAFHAGHSVYPDYS